jgi:hypothetical protein
VRGIVKSTFSLKFLDDYKKELPLNLSLPLHSNLSDCGGIQFDSSKYLEKYLPKSPHFDLKFQTDLAF